METKKKMGFLEKLGFSVFAGGYNLLYIFKGSYYLFFLTEVLGISIAVAGTLIAAGGIWDAVNDPLIAYYTVNHTSKKGEHIRYSLLYFAVPVAICFVLLFTNYHTSDTVTIIIAALAFFIYDSMLTFLGIGYSTMNTVATDDQTERTSVNIFRSFGSNLGTVIGTLGCFPLLNAFGALDENGNLIKETADRGFFLVALIFAAIAVFSSLFHYFTTKERVLPHDESQHVSFMDMLKDLLGYKQFNYCTIQVMAYNVAVLIMQTVVNYYSTYVMGSTAMSTTFLAMFIVGMLLGSAVLVQPLDKKLGHKKTMLLGAVLFAVGKIPFVFAPENMIMAVVNFVLSGIGAALLYVTIFVYYSNIGDLVEWRSGKRMDACTGAVSSFVTVISSSIATEIIALVLDAAGFDSALASQPQSAIKAINLLLGLAPLLVSLLMVVVTYLIDIDSEMEQMKAETNK